MVGIFCRHIHGRYLAYTAFHQQDGESERKARNHHTEEDPAHRHMQGAQQHDHDGEKGKVAHNHQRPVRLALLLLFLTFLHFSLLPSVLKLQGCTLLVSGLLPLVLDRRCCPQVFDGAHKGERREAVEGNGIQEDQESRGRCISSNGACCNKGIVAKGIDHKGQSDPDGKQAELLDHLDSRRAIILHHAFLLASSAARLLLLPLGIQAKHQEEQSELERKGDQETNVKGDVTRVDGGLCVASSEHLVHRANGRVHLPEIGTTSSDDAYPSKNGHSPW